MTEAADLHSMASKDPIDNAAKQFVAAAYNALNAGNYDAMSPSDLAAVLTVAVKLFVGKAESDPQTGTPIIRDEVSPTEVVQIAGDLLQVFDLSPFDLSMWYGRHRA